MNVLTYGSTAVAACVLASSLLLSKRMRSGWAVSVLANAVGVAYDLVTRQPGFLAMSAVMLVISSRAWFAWASPKENANG